MTRRMWDFWDRFPLQPSGGVVLPDDESSSVRPFGMGYAVTPLEAGKHEKPTQVRPVTKKTEYTDDSKTRPDTKTEQHRD